MKPHRHHRPLPAALAAAATLAVQPGRARTVVFSQNFNTAIQNPDATGTGPNQFDGIPGSVFNVSDGALSDHNANPARLPPG